MEEICLGVQLCAQLTPECLVLPPVAGCQLHLILAFPCALRASAGVLAQSGQSALGEENEVGRVEVSAVFYMCT